MTPTARAALAWSLWAAAARAEPDPAPRASLELDAGASAPYCISRAELEQAVQIQLGRVVFVNEGAPPELRVRVRLAQLSAPARVHAWISAETVTAEGASAPPAAVTAPSARELETPGDCRALDAEAALVVALLVDRDIEPPVAAPAPAVVVPPPPPEPDEPVQDTGPVSSAPGWEAGPTGPWTLDLDAAAAASFALLPHVAYGGELGGMVTPPGWPALRFRVCAFAPDAVDLAPDVRMTFFAAFGGVALCPALREGKFELRACFGADLTLFNATETGLSGDGATLRVGAQASATLRGSLRLGEGWLTALALGVAFPTRVDRFTYETDGVREEAFRTASAPTSVTLGVTREFR